MNTIKTIGFPVSKKENENRRALLPPDVARIDNPGQLFFESGYGSAMGFPDEAYTALGAHMASRGEVLRQDIVCDPKIGDAEYLESLNGQIVFGWLHAVQNREITDKLVNRRLSAYAWEDMYEDGRHTFWRNNEIAGEAAIMHAFQCHGLMPYNAKVALLGRGNVAAGALKILTLLGAEVTTYNRQTEKLFRQELPVYDVIVNAVLWDVSRTDHIVYREDLGRMKPGAMIIDISCDRGGGIESSIPTAIEQPTYTENGIVHYVVDHTPSLFYKTISKDISGVLPPFLNELMSGKPGAVLQAAHITENGEILDPRICEFQNRPRR